MASLDDRTGWLLQVPSRVLRALIVAHVTADRQKEWLDKQGIRFRDPRAALNRLTVEQLIQLINDPPLQVPDEAVQAEFEEYRHGRSPTLQLYTVPPAALVGFDLAQANEWAQSAVQRANRELEVATQEAGLTPRLCGLAFEPFAVQESWPDGLHAGYQVQSRLDYIATDGRAASLYQLYYGHAWLDLGRAFVALQSHPASLESALVEILWQVVRGPLRLVQIDKELKRTLRFLQKASCRRSRLVDPNPDRKRFRSITLADDEDLAGRQYLGWTYEQWEDDFPEIASARYTARFVEDRETSLSIGLRRGTLTLSGAVAASHLQDWARDTGGQIVDVWRAREKTYLAEPPAALDHERLWQHPLLEGWPDDLRRMVLALVQALATIKARKDRLFQSWPLPLPALDLAAAGASRQAQELLGEASHMGGPAPWFQVQVRIDCPQEGCPAPAEHLVCPSCGRTLFHLFCSDQGEWGLMCANPYCAERWAGGFPIQTQCREEHPIEVAWDGQMGERLELFAEEGLRKLLQQLLAGEAAAIHFDASGESLWIRDGRLVYQPTRPAYLVRQAGDLYVNTGGGAYVGGSVQTGGDFIGRDQTVLATGEPAPA
jgi:hypothetical protein